MDIQIDLWRLAAGLGLFLFGMFQLEHALRQLAGRSFKKFLRRHTENPVKGVLAGAVSTAALQSSSVVGLIVLALAGSGVITLASALGIVFGSNLGTTATGWIVATIGFKLNIESLALPLVAVGGLGVVWSAPASRRACAERLVRYIRVSEEKLPELAIESLVQETRRLTDQACALNQVALGHRPDRSFYDSASDRHGVAIFEYGADFDHCYGELKQLEGEILAFVLRLQKSRLSEEESSSLGALIPAVRNAVHSAKCMKDVRMDLQAFRQSATDSLNAYHSRYREVAREFYTKLETLKEGTTDVLMFELLVDLNKTNDVLHAATHSEIYQDMLSGRLSEQEVSTLLNVNREVLLSNRNLLAAIAGACLPAERADIFTSLPTAV